MGFEVPQSKRSDSKTAEFLQIYDVLDQTASVKLTAEWGIDYMHLAQMDGKWMIINVLWQSHPAKK